MSKIQVVVSCPVDTYSGYGARARDFVQALLEMGKYDVRILSQRWGNTRQGYLDDHGRDDLSSLIIPNLTSQPDVWIQITVPNEFQRVGKYNIGVTAGIETTLASPQWVMGCNVMDLVITSSEHSKLVFLESKYDMTDSAKGTREKIEVSKPVEVLLEGADTNKYRPLELPAKFNLKDDILENFCFLAVGHWLPGALGHDRKNIGLLVRLFLESFKNKPNPPALILKVSMMTSSVIDRNKILSNIEKIKNDVKGTLPNIYLLHGDLTDQEMNELYNNAKVKAMISLTKGEGFGRPLLEFSLVNKPIIASAWSGHMDFLDKELAMLVGGELKPLHKSSISEEVLVEGSSWFFPYDNHAMVALKELHKNYDKYRVNAKKLGYKNRTNFSFDKMKTILDEMLTKYLPEFPKQIELKLPKLNLPKLEKIK
jgi:glycosyltransferase involved in cell wall biosynthesis